MRIQPAPIQTALIDKDGKLTPPWMRWFQDLSSYLVTQSQWKALFLSPSGAVNNSVFGSVAGTTVNITATAATAGTYILPANVRDHSTLSTNLGSITMVPNDSTLTIPAGTMWINGSYSAVV